MTRLECINHHFFDGDIYQLCPICNAPADENVPAEKVEIGNIGGAVNQTGYLYENQKKEIHTVAIGDSDQKTNVLADPNAQGKKPPVTKPIDSGSDSYVQKGTPGIFVDIDQGQNKYLKEKSRETTGKIADVNTPSKKQSKSETSDDIKVEISNPNAEVVIMPKEKDKYDDGKTKFLYDDLFTVGWLACIKGENFGETFELVDGYNLIGRAPDMNVSISKDKTVSRHKHAVISFDPETIIFKLTPNLSCNMVQINGEAITDEKIIKAYDRIKIGKTELLFVPLCCKTFNWKDNK